MRTPPRYTLGISGDALRIAFHGDLVQPSIRGMRIDLVNSLITQRATHPRAPLLVDFTNVDHIDSYGLDLLVKLLRAGRSEEAPKPRIRIAKEKMIRLIRFTRLDEAMEVVLSSERGH
jgi:anti-anti-sigma factor